MTEILKIPWGTILLNFVWVMGVAIILAVFSYSEFLAYIQKAKRKEVYKRNFFKKPLILGLILIVVGISASFLLQISSAKPELISFKNMIKIAPSSLEGRKIIDDDSIFMPWNTAVRSKKIQFEKAKYEIRITSKGSEAGGESARLKIFIGLDDLIADYFTSAEYKEKIIEFQSEKKQRRKIKIEFVNDYNDPVTNADRNAWIESIVIIKIDDILK